MAKFACLPSLSVVKKKKSMGFPKAVDGSKKGSCNGELRVMPVDLINSCPESDLKENHLTVSKSFPSLEKAFFISPLVQSGDCFGRTEPTEEAAYEGDDEHGQILSMKRHYSDLDLQRKGEPSSHGSNADLCSYVLEKTVTDEGIVAEAMIANGDFISDSRMKLTASLQSPILKRSCSNIEIMQGKQWIKSPKRSGSYSNLQNFSENCRGEIIRETHSSPLSVRTSYSTDRVMLKRQSSCEVLPSRSKNIWRKLFHQSHRNPPKPRASQRLISVLSAPNLSSESEKTCSINNRRVAVEVTQANVIIQSLNTFSTVAQIPGVGLKVIPSIAAFVCLRTVSLSGNSIVNITPGSLPKNLHTLDLSRNNLSTIEGLRELEKLRILNLSYNRITKIGHGLSCCTLIKELYLAGNKISNVEGLHRLLKLKVLDLSFNKIITAKGLGQLVANYNTLLALNLLGNPILSNIGDDQVKKAVLNLLPHVTFLNKQHIKPHKVREVVCEKVTKAALGDAAESSKRKLTKRLSQGSGSLPKHSKGRHSTSEKYAQ